MVDFFFLLFFLFLLEAGVLRPRMVRGPLALSVTGGSGVWPSWAGTRPSSLSSMARAAPCLACFLLLPLPVAVRSPRITWKLKVGACEAPSAWTTRYWGVIPRDWNLS